MIAAYHAIWNSGEVEKLPQVLNSDFVCHFLSSGKWEGIEGVTTEINSWKRIFPDWEEEIVDFVVENDKVVTRYRSTGTHSGIYQGIDSTGIKVEIYEVSIYRVENGKIAEQWCFPDDVALKQQLLNFFP